LSTKDYNSEKVNLLKSSTVHDKSDSKLDFAVMLQEHATAPLRSHGLVEAWEVISRE